MKRETRIVQICLALVALLIVIAMVSGCMHTEEHHCVEEGWCHQHPGDMDGVER